MNSNTINIEKGKMCQYCGEEQAQVRIANPNGLMEGSPWDVCYVCEKVIKAQQKMTLGVLLSQKEPGHTQRYGEKILNEAKEDIEYLSKESGKAVLSVAIQRKNRSLLRNKVEIQRVRNAVLSSKGVNQAPREKECKVCLNRLNAKKKKGILSKIRAALVWLWE
jgi:hypothetical protein